jgi:hypothetical protein
MAVADVIDIIAIWHGSATAVTVTTATVTVATTTVTT